MQFPQFFAGDRVVIDLLGPLRRRLINVPAQPDGLNEDADVLVMVQGQRGEVLDARVGKEDRRKGQHVRLAALECFLDLVRFVPMLNDSRTANRRKADLNVSRDPRLLAEIGHNAGNKHMKAVPTRERTRCPAVIGSANRGESAPYTFETPRHTPTTTTAAKRRLDPP